jgi:hypothetical protein
MRKAIGWAVSWALYWIGWVVNKGYFQSGLYRKMPMICNDLFSAIAFALTTRSFRVQHWGGVGQGYEAWGPVIKGEE